MSYYIPYIFIDNESKGMIFSIKNHELKIKSFFAPLRKPFASLAVKTKGRERIE
jgi:hypothetical protein